MHSEDDSTKDNALGPNHANPTPLDPNLCSLSPEGAHFFKSVTRITSDEELKAHILAIQEMAYKIAPYPCIYGFGFLKPKLAENPVYPEVVKLGRERDGAILLDVGTFGVDARRAAFDGFSPCSIVTCDIKQEYFELGHLLFRTSKESYPAHFIHGDALDPKTLAIASPYSETPSSPPSLVGLTSLNPLRGQCSVINASAFFHIFDEERQLHLARALAGLLSPAPGSIICGAHAGAPEKKTYSRLVAGNNYSLMFCHSPRSWTELWDGLVFEKHQVEVKAEIRSRVSAGRENWTMIWSVRKL